MTTLVWFRQDLRLGDNPALAAAIGDRDPVIPIFVHAPDEEGAWQPGAASRWWLHHSLERLGEELAARGSRLTLRHGASTLTLLTALIDECGATRVVWNRRYEPAVTARDQAVKTALRARGIAAESFNGALLHEPWTIHSKTDAPFQVFTPFGVTVCRSGDPPSPLPVPAAIKSPETWPASVSLASFGLEPKIDWAQGMRDAWTPGSAGAQAALNRFLAQDLEAYPTQRDIPAAAGTSRLSPHLHFGEISPREIWHAMRTAAQDRRGSDFRASKFLAELGWREFAHHLLYHFPHTVERPLRVKYANFPWKRDAALAAAWTRGATGYPIVDAGLRELWRTGWMHNRVRMIVGSFLIKDLLTDWKFGARWFWDTLVDADLANNTLGWQWIAGCGADAAPFFRIFNPTLQGTKFDPDGVYVRRWVPEISALSNEWIHRPWAAPPQVLAAAGVKLGEHYPQPVVDHDVARGEALRALSDVND